MTLKTGIDNKANWPVLAVFAIGVVLIAIGEFVRPGVWSAVVWRTIVDIGAGFVLAAVVAFFIAPKREEKT